MFAGDLLAAAAVVDQAEALADAIDNRGVRNAAVTLAAFRGREHEARDMIEASAKDFSERGEGLGLNMTLWATTVLGNGLARYQDAFEAADEVLADPYDLWFAPFAAVELIEAASRTGNHESASAAPGRLVGSTSLSGTYWGGAVEARSRALVTAGSVAETLYREAIDLLTGTPLRLDMARSHLLYGEWLRRERRPREAREQLGAPPQSSTTSARCSASSMSSPAPSSRSSSSNRPPAHRDESENLHVWRVSLGGAFEQCSKNDDRLNGVVMVRPREHRRGHLLQGDASYGWRDDPTIDKILCDSLQNIARLAQDKVHTADPRP
jgi:hypothetical protein